MIEVKENVKGCKISDEAAVCTLPDNYDGSRSKKMKRITKVNIDEGQVDQIFSAKQQNESLEKASKKIVFLGL